MPNLLVVDLSINCSSPKYLFMFWYAALCCVAFCVGIPGVVFFKLYRWRYVLNPQYEDESRAMRARLKNKAMLADPIVELALPFKPSYWWFEVFSLGRRFALTSLILALDNVKSTTVYTVLVVCSIHVVEREWAPLIDPTISNFSYGLNWQILLSVIYMLFLDA